MTFSPNAIEFSSDPSGAKVELDDGQTCTTPCRIHFSKVVKQNAEATLPDGRSDTKELGRRPAIAVWFNFVIGPYGAPGVGIDWLTDSFWTYSAKKVKFDFPDANDDDDDDDEDDTAAAAATGKAKVKPPAAAPAPAPAEADANNSAPPPDPLSPGQLPRTPVMQRVMEAYPEGVLTTEVRYYYGAQPTYEERSVIARIYKILARMQENGERPDVDEAIREDSFANPKEPEKPAP